MQIGKDKRGCEPCSHFLGQTGLLRGKGGECISLERVFVLQESHREARLPLLTTSNVLLM